VRFQQVEVATQELALARLAEQTKRTMSAPIVRQTVLAILADCPSRDDACELNAIFNAVKNGDPRVRPGRDRLMDDVRADEASAAGDEDAHQRASAGGVCMC